MTNRTVLELIGITRETLIDKGLDIIDRDGLARFSVERITVELNIKPGALYKFFRMADEVQNALTARALAMLVGAHDDVGMERKGRAALEAHALVERAFGLAHPAIYAAALRGPLGLSAEINAQRQAYLNTMMRMLRGYDIAPGLAPELATCLSAALQGFISAESAGRGRSGAECDRNYERLLDMMDITAHRARENGVAGQLARAARA